MEPNLNTDSKAWNWDWTYSPQKVGCVVPEKLCVRICLCTGGKRIFSCTSKSCRVIFLKCVKSLDNCTSKKVLVLSEITFRSFSCTSKRQRPHISCSEICCQGDNSQLRTTNLTKFLVFVRSHTRAIWIASALKITLDSDNKRKMCANRKIWDNHHVCCLSWFPSCSFQIQLGLPPLRASGTTFPQNNISKTDSWNRQIWLPLTGAPPRERLGFFDSRDCINSSQFAARRLYKGFMSWLSSSRRT